MKTLPLATSLPASPSVSPTLSPVAATVAARARALLASVLVLGALLVTAVLAPGAHAAPAGQLYGAGYGGEGNFGISEDAYLYAFMPIPGLSNVVQASPGYYYSLALLSNGTVEATGYNDYGELGDGTDEARWEFAPVHGLSNVTAIAAGGYFGAALLSDGTVETWGYGYHDELGDGSSSRSTVPVQVKGVGGVGKLEHVVAISAGYDDMMALLENGTVVDWGDGEYYELGNEEDVSSDVPVVVKGVGGVGTLEHVTAISAGGYFNTALLSNGTVVTWGYGHYGELGNGADEGQWVPVQVKGIGGVGTLEHVTAVSDGFYGAYALLSNGTVVAWGENDDGQLGDGTEESSDVPVHVSDLSDVTQIAAGEGFGQALTATGQLYGWGYNYYGALGTGRDGAEKVTVPMPPDSVTPTGVFALSHGDYNYQSLIIQGADLAVSGSGMKFAGQTVGTKSTSQSVTVKNEGPAAVTISGDALSGSAAFTKTADACQGATLAAGATCSIAVAFSPSALGAASATMTLSSTAANTLPALSLTGTGMPPTAKPVLGKISLSKRRFAAATAGASAQSAGASGTIVSYTDSEAVMDRLAVQRKLIGVVQGHGRSRTCAPAHGHSGPAAKPCVYYEPVGSFLNVDQAGTVRFRFSGRLGGHALSAGNYRLVAVSRSSAGASNVRTAIFTVVGR